MLIHDRFIFNNVDSLGMNVAIVWDKSGLQTQAMFKKTINEDKNTLHSTELSNQEFTIKIALFNDVFTSIVEMPINKRRELVEWLCKDYYLPFQTFENQSIFFYVMFSEVTRNYITNNNSGYLELKAKCDSAYCASHFDIYNLKCEDELFVELPNKGDIETKPTIEILALDDSGITIKNLTNGKTIELTTQENEVIDIDCQGLYIKSSLVKNKYKEFNRTFITLPRGINRIKIEGNCKIKFKYQHHFLI